MSERAAYEAIPFDDDADEVKTWKGLALSAISDMRRYADDELPHRRMVSAEAYETDAVRLHGVAPCTREPMTDAALKDAATEYLSHRGENPYRVLRSGSQLWETHVASMKAAFDVVNRLHTPPARSAASTVEPVAHKIMTDEEYAALRIDGWHLVCKDYQGEPGCVGIQYTPTSPEPDVTASPSHTVPPFCGEAQNGSPEPDAVKEALEQARDKLIEQLGAGRYRANFAFIDAALSRPAHGGWEEVLRQIMQRANESGTGEMALMDTIHAMYRLAADALARNERATPQPITDGDVK